MLSQGSLDLLDFPHLCLEGSLDRVHYLGGRAVPSLAYASRLWQCSAKLHSSEKQCSAFQLGLEEEKKKQIEERKKVFRSLPENPHDLQ